jgi:hypothetical protein
VLVFFLDETFEEVAYDITTTVGRGCEGGRVLGTRPPVAARVLIWAVHHDL